MLERVDVATGRPFQPLVEVWISGLRYQRLNALQ